jgi:hypothetical protein
MSPPKPVAPPPAPTMNDARMAADRRDRALARRATSVLTSESGLPDLGTVARPQAM